MLIKYGPGYGEDDRIDFADSIFENTIESMKTLIHQSQNSGEEKADCQMQESSLEAAQKVRDLDDDARITREIADAIETLWNDSGIKGTFNLRSQFQVPDSASYFFNRVHALAAVPYVPTQDDVLRCRDRTAGINSETLDIPDVGGKFDIFDVGGQRSERKHWVNVFKNVKAVLFVVAISEYDQLCFEDEETNRLDEALKVFTMVSNSKHFEKTPIILLFNKVDLFKIKLEMQLPFDFEDYQGPQDYGSITNFIREKFESRNATEKECYYSFVSAIDANFDCMDIFQSVKDYHANNP
eukprot:TRINITY_DN5939_c0_g1_i2.p1 TRINITY_DN5939_c0_g1~~TRINITY_DN5939_c0_g1_i2.p1  ORF type:complete len:297 (-),score=67.76 TRINITY_DN5939_c0_g1_i2:136-1026(-)